jgi:subtilisin family serine protease
MQPVKNKLFRTVTSQAGTDTSGDTARPAGSAGAWWLKNYHIPEIWARGDTGLGVKIAVLDTGISFPHTDLQLDLALLHDVTGSSSGIRDLNGHGTHCAGIIKAVNKAVGPTGVAYNAELLICKITSDDFGDTSDYQVAGIEWAIAQDVDIISISKGDPFGNPPIQAALSAAKLKGILVVASAGNKIAGYPDDHIYYPGRYDECLSVGGIDELEQPLADSLLTGETKIFAPGKDILSTWPDNSFNQLSGSSQATPFVAGVCALALEFYRKRSPGFHAADLESILIQNATVAPFGKIINVNGIFNLNM